MKLNEITGKKCWAILDYDDNSHAHDVTVDSVYLSEKEAQLISMFNEKELVTEVLIKNGFLLNYTLTKQEEFKKNKIRI